MAFAIASGVTPAGRHLCTAIIAGFLISLLGGSRVQIGGPTGAYIVIVYGIVVQYGVANLIVCTVAAGVLLLRHGRCSRLGGLIRFIPVSIVIGFTNGIAVLILLSQVKDFLGLDITMPDEFFTRMRTIGAQLRPGRAGDGRARVACLAVLLALAEGDHDVGRGAGAGPRAPGSRAKRRRRCATARSPTRRVAAAGCSRGCRARSSSWSLASLVVALPGSTWRRSARASAAFRSGFPRSRWPDISLSTLRNLVAPTDHDRAARRHRVAAVARASPTRRSTTATIPTRS